MHQSWLSYTQTYIWQRLTEHDRHSDTLTIAAHAKNQIAFCVTYMKLWDSHLLLGNACRMTPNKKSMAAAFAVFGSSVSGLVRYLFGRWIPSWQQLVYNKVRKEKKKERKEKKEKKRKKGRKW